MRNGASARMSAVNPTVTWPNHTTMVTGVRADKHGLLANGTITRTGGWPPVKVEPMIDKESMVHVPTVYDAAHKAGLSTAQVDWVAIHNAPSITWAFREWASAEGPLEKEMLAKGVITPADLQDFSKANILHRDQIWTRAGAYLIAEHKPDLLLLHLLTLDSMQHQNGPNTLAARAAMAFLDSCVEKLVTAVKEAGLADRTTFLIVSDHGFKAHAKQIHPPNLQEKIYILPEGGSAFVYFDDPSQVAAVRKQLAAIEGIERIYGVEDYASLGLPTPVQDPQFGHLLLAAKSGYSFSVGTGGSHGYLASDPEMNSIFIASGAGVRPGVNIGTVSNLDVAATIAHLLGVALPTSIGKPIPLN